MKANEMLRNMPPLLPIAKVAAFVKNSAAEAGVPIARFVSPPNRNTVRSPRCCSTLIPFDRSDPCTQRFSCTRSDLFDHHRLTALATGLHRVGQSRGAAQIVEGRKRDQPADHAT